MKAVTGFRPVAINVGVRDLEEAIRFYETVFGEQLDVSPSRDHARWSFGEGDSFFLFNMRRRDACDPHRDHVSAFGFSVSDLDAAHARAVGAGAVEHFPPMEEAGMPRHSRFADPSGNRVVLWEAGQSNVRSSRVSRTARPRPGSRPAGCTAPRPSTAAGPWMRCWTR